MLRVRAWHNTRFPTFIFVPYERPLLSESKPSDSTLDSAPVSFPPQADPFFDELLATSSAKAPPAPAREGLPPSYKMRNAHYVDELEARTSHLAEDDPRVAVPALPEAPAGPPPRRLLALALTELTRGLDGLSSCFNLLSPQPSPLRERLALQLAQVEARRAGRVSQSLRVLLEAPRIARRAVSAAEVLQRVVGDLRDELQLARIDLKLDVTEPVPAVWADPYLFGVAVSGMVGALVPILETAESSARLRAGIFKGDRSVTVRLQPEGAEPMGALSRFFDPEWVDRPGGVAASVALAAARRIAHLHGGRLEAVKDQAGELVLSLTLPAHA